MNARTTFTQKISRIFGVAGSFGLVAGLLSGCSTSATPNSNNTVSAPAVSVPVLITDAPSDQLLSFSLTINSIVLNDSAGKSATVLSTPTTIEICHLNGIQAPLVTASIPQDTYTSAVITFSNPQITYVSSTAAAMSVTPTLATTSFTFTFPTPFTVSNANTSLLFDLIASQSVAISGTTVTVTPVFKVMPVPPASAVPPAGQNGTGMQQMATVVSVSGTSVVLQPGSGPNFTVTTDSSTVLQGFSSLSSLTAGELVQVDFIVSGGCSPLNNACANLPPVLLATRIQLAPPAVAGQPPVNLLNGPVTSVASGSFKMAVMQGLGPNVAPTAVASSLYTITVNGSTVFAAAPQFVSITNLPFVPTFTAANLTAGQTVGVVASTTSGTSATAADVYLIPQTLGGTVTAISTVGSWTKYTLTLNSGSAFTTLSGVPTVTVYTDTATAGPPPTPAGATAPPAIAVGSNVRFNGLVFNTGSGTFAMIAGCSPDGPPGI